MHLICIYLKHIEELLKALKKRERERERERERKRERDRERERFYFFVGVASVASEHLSNLFVVFFLSHLAFFLMLCMAN